MLSDQLLDLRVHSTNPIVRRCLQAIENSEIKYSPGVVLSLERVLDVYTRRARINSELNGGIIGGFEELLGSLNKASKDSFVKLESFELVSRWFTIFTDEDYSVLFGMLESPKTKAEWFDPVKGYNE